MAFVVQCPFCKLLAKVPNRALGAIGHCPKCANSFTLASLDDQHTPDSTLTPLGDSDIEPVPASQMSTAIAVADAVVAANAPAPIDTQADAPPSSAPSHPAAAAGALALFLSGVALVGGSFALLRGLVLPVSILAVLLGLIALVVACLSARPRLLLPLTGSAAAATMFTVAWLFPALLGPAYEHYRKRPEPTPRGLHAIPLGAAPVLAEVPEWADAKRYALERDGLRVQVLRAGSMPANALKGKVSPKVKQLLMVQVRVSLDRADARPLEQKDDPKPTLGDETGKTCAYLLSEFLDRGGGKSKPGLFLTPTIEETFVFEAPPDETPNLRLELPAARWRGTGVFQFTLAPQTKSR